MNKSDRQKPVAYFYVCCLTTLSVSRLYSVHDAMINEYWLVGAIRIKTAYDPAWDGTRAAAVEIRLLTAWTMERPNYTLLGRAIDQAVGRRLPTSSARVGAQVRSCGIYDGQSGTGAGFIRVRQFPLPILIPPTASLLVHSR
jgi:hypothetical protein